MKKILLFNTFFFCFLVLKAQKPENVYSITKKQKKYAYYSQQADLWEKEVKKVPNNAKAWKNYFVAARMNNMFAGQDGNRYELHTLAEDLKKNLPNTFEYYYVSYKLETDTDKALVHLKKAAAIDPDRYEPWDAFITKAESDDDTETMKMYFEKWYQHEMYSPGITTWNYNVLIGLEQDAVILTFGDNDTYPLWFLQSFKNMRTDVKVINTSVILRPNYQAKVFKELNIPAFEQTLEETGDFQIYRDAMMEHLFKHVKRPLYIGISAPRSFRKKHEEDLYITGLAFKYCKEDFDHVAVLRKNFESLYLKDYLKVNLDNDFSQSVVDHMNQQYLPALTVLYKHYLLSDETQKAAEVKELLISIGEKNNKTSEINQFIAKFKNK